MYWFAVSENTTINLHLEYFAQAKAALKIFFNTIFLVLQYKIKHKIERMESASKVFYLVRQRKQSSLPTIKYVTGTLRRYYVSTQTTQILLDYYKQKNLVLECSDLSILDMFFYQQKIEWSHRVQSSWKNK